MISYITYVKLKTFNVKKHKNIAQISTY